MPIVLADGAIQGATGISASGTTYGITQTSAGIVNFPYRPSFFAYGIGSGTYAVGSNMIYPTTQVNTGSYYNVANGVFTCPIAGTYLFHWSNIGNATSGVYRMYFYYNGATTNNTHLRLDNSDTGSAYCINGNYTITWNCAANDTVQVRYDAGPTSLYPDTNSVNNDYLTFSGWLVG